MNAVPFDTLKLARDLEAAGMAPPVAAGTAAALADAMASTDFATKSDLALVESRVLGALNEAKAEVMGVVRELEGKTDSRFAALDVKLELLRRDMTIKLGGMIFVAVGVILAAMRLMPHP